MAYIILIANAKGGVGKTTISSNISHILSCGGNKVLHVDLDPQGSGTTLFTPLDMNNNTMTFDDIISLECEKVLYEPVNIENIIFKTRYENLDIIPNTRSVHDLFSKGTFDERYYKCTSPNKHMMFKNNLAQVDDKYDYIILDGHPALDMKTKVSMIASDAVITPAVGDVFNLKTVDDIVNMLAMCMDEAGVDIQYLGFFLNNVADVKSDNYLSIRDYYLDVAEEFFVDCPVRTSPSVIKASSSLNLWLEYSLNYTIGSFNPLKDLLKLLYHEFGIIDEECKENLIKAGVKPKFFEYN